MSQRKSIIVAEESNISSPLRRSSRIASSPAPAAIGTRRSSATVEFTSTPAKITRAKRLSLSQDTSSKVDVAAPRRGSSVTKDDRPAAATPSKRTSMRKSSTTKDAEETTQRVATPARTLPANEGESVTPKPRGRRPSVTEKIIPLESIDESEPKEINKPVARSRRSSANSHQEPVEEEPKKVLRPAPKRRLSVTDRVTPMESIEENLPNPRRSNRGASKSPAKIEQENENVKIKNNATVQELDAIVETSFAEEEDVFVNSPRRSVRARSITPIKCCESGTQHTHSPKNIHNSPIREKIRSVSKSPSLSNNEIAHKTNEADLLETEQISAKESKIIPTDSPKLPKSVEREKTPQTKRISVNLTPNDIQKVNSPPVIVKASPNLLKHMDDAKETIKPNENEDKIKETVASKNGTSDLVKTPLKEFKSPKLQKKTDTPKSKLLVNELEMTSGSDGSFHLNISIPVSNSSQEDENHKELEQEKILNTSSGSDHSDKENVSKTPQIISRSPSGKSPSKNITPVIGTPQPRKSLRTLQKETSTPHLNTPKQNQSFFEPMEVEYASDVDVSILQPKDNIIISENVVSSSRKSLDSSLQKTSGDYDDVEDEEENCTSPVKKILHKKVIDDTETSLDEVILLDDDDDDEADEQQKKLLDSFVDEVQDEENVETNTNKTEKRKSAIKDHENKRKSQIKCADTSENAKALSPDKKNDSIIEDKGTPLSKSKQKKCDVQNESNLTKDKDTYEIVSDDESFVSDVVDEDSDDITHKKRNLSKEDIEIIEFSDSEEEQNQKTEMLTNPKISRLKEVISIDSSENDDAKSPKNKSLQSKLIALIAKKVSEDCSSSEDETYVPTNEFIDDMAFEGEEDTPSEGSNDIIEEGESLHSTDSEADSIEEEYEDESNSFICDDEVTDLLSGEEFDLGNEKNSDKNKEIKKSRIITLPDSSDEEEEVITLGNGLEESVTPLADTIDLKIKEQLMPKINILQDIKITPTKPKAPVNTEEMSVINIDDNLPSLETIKSSTNQGDINTILLTKKNFPESLPNTPNTSISSRRKTSITIHENIKMDDLNESEITEKISKAVDFLRTSMREQGGNISLNMSLDYTAENCAEVVSPKVTNKTNRTTRNKNSVTVDDFTVEDGENVTITGKHNKRTNLIQEFEVDTKSPIKNKKRASLQPKFAVEDVSQWPKMNIKKNVHKDQKNSSEFSGDIEEPKIKKSSIRKESKQLHIESAEGTRKHKEKRKSSEFQEEVVENKKRKKVIESDYLSDNVFDTSTNEVTRKSKKKSKKNQFIPSTSNISYLSDDILEEIVDDIKVSVSEISEIPIRTASTHSVNTAPSRKTKCSWNIDQSDMTKPSKKNKNKTVLDKIVKKQKKESVNLNEFLPNDFKRRMLYDANVPRIHSKDIIKGKARRAHKE